MIYGGQRNMGPSSFCGYLLHQWRIFGKRFVMTLEKLLQMLAFKISKRPFLVIGVTLSVACLFISGFAKLNVETNAKYLFVPEDNQALRDLKRAARYGYNLELRQEEIIILPKKNESILSTKCMEEVLELHQVVVGIDEYETLCYRPFLSTDPCVSLNVLEAFNYMRENLDDPPSRIEMLIANESFILANTRTLRDNYYGLFGSGIWNGSLDDVAALRMVYYMAEHDKDDPRRKDILTWETTFSEKMSIFTGNKTCIGEIAYSAERSLDDSVGESTASDVRFFAATFTIMGMFSAAVNGRCCSGTHGHQLLGFASMAAIYLGVIGSFGMLLLARVPFVSMAGILPFLIVSIGIDDVFIILHELNENIRGPLPSSHVIGLTMAKAGSTITMTTLTDLVAFAVSCHSIFPAVRYFCSYAVASISFVFILMITFFVACMYLDVKKIRKKKRRCFPSIGNTQPSCCVWFPRCSLDNIMDAWGRRIMTRTGKLMVCTVSLLLLGGGIYGVFNIDESFERQLLTKDHSHYRRYLDIFEEYFHLEIDVNVIIPGNLNYSDDVVQKQFVHLENIAKKNQYYKTKVTSWLPEYLQWEKRHEGGHTHKFYQKFQFFVLQPEYRRFFHDVIFSEDKERVIASRLKFYSESNPSSNFQKEMMNSIRKDLAEQSELDAFAVQQYFVYFEQYAHVISETIRNLVIAGISILVITSLFLSHPVIILCLLLGFFEIILALFGLMHLLNVSINSISMINLVMALGFSVDYNAHVAYHFVSAKSSSVDQRVIDALRNVGGSVFLGGVSTFLGMLPTSMASSLVFQIFFKMFFGIVLLGLVHGLVILPVYLSLLGRIFNFQQVNATNAFAKWLVGKNLATKDQRGLTGQKASKSKLPVAVVGMSCRFPGGVRSKEDFWNMLVDGRCGIDSYPKNRPTTRLFEDFYNPDRNTPGKHYVLKGAFLDDILGFDAHFFGLSTTECKSMDPQQRILLHVVYEAIEDAGIPLEDLQKIQTGVYVGLMNIDYGNLVLNDENIRNIDQFASTGATYSVTANRISFLLNLTGPSLTVDTACSSSLTALHLAFGHLQSGETDVAIVCAPNILLNGRQFHVACCRAGMLAEDGCCKSFDIKGDGYGRGEGVAAVILTLSSRITGSINNGYAEIIASGVNNDGQSSIPMTSPSELGQRTLFRKVLRESGLSKDDISYVEAHGTGTAVGDVVEMASIAAVYGNSEERTLRVGTVKSNVNHTESAAGLAGLIKTCLMIERGQFVPTINVHCQKPELRIPETNMVVQVSYEPWKSDDCKPRTAAVSSYGYGGSNAHLIVRELPRREGIPMHNLKPRKNRVMTLSARSGGALKDLAKATSQYLQMLQGEDDELLKDDFCYSLNERYTTHSHRLAVTFATFDEIVAALDMFCIQREGWSTMVSYVSDTSSMPRKNIVFLYGGQGTRWYGMATEMMKYEPVFKESIKEIDCILNKLDVPWLLFEELEKTREESRIEENPIGQMALFGVHYALTKLLKSWGIAPAAVLGFSLGEISAACTAGCLTLKQAVKLILIRANLQERCSTTGSMVAVGLSENDAEKMLRDLDLDDVLDIAVVNSSKDVVLSGDQNSINVLRNHLAEQHDKIFWRELSVTRAFHSKHMQNIKDEFFSCLKKTNLQSSHESIPFFSSVTGTQVSGNEINGDHWWHNIREKVQFSAALEALFNDGHRTFLEVNAGPQLARHVLSTWATHGSHANGGNDVVVIQTLPKRGVEHQHRAFLHNSVAHMFTSGLPVKWRKIQGCGSKTFMRRPNYPWQEAEYWYRNRERRPVGYLDENVSEKKVGEVVESHPLLGARLAVKPYCSLYAWENETETYKLPYLKDHKFTTHSDPVIPAAVYVEMVFAAVKHVAPDSSPDVREMSFENLITISDADSFRMRTRLTNRQMEEPSAEFQITKVEDEDETEILLSKGHVVYDLFGKYAGKMGEPRDQDNFELFKKKLMCEPSDIVGAKRKEANLNFGSEFDLIRGVWTGKKEVFIEIGPTEKILCDSSLYVIHPCIIDACFQCCLFFGGSAGQPVPYKIHNMLLQRARVTMPMYCHAQDIGSNKSKLYDITLYDCYGQVVLLINRFSTVDVASFTTKTNYKNAVFTEEWPIVEPSTGFPENIESIETNWIILQDGRGISDLFETCLPRDSVIFTVEYSTPNENIPDVIQGYLLAKHSSGRNRHMGYRSKFTVVNFRPVDAGNFLGNNEHFEESHRISFESSLLTLKTLVENQQLSSGMHIVLVTMEAVPINTTSGQSNDLTFPWSATAVGFRRTIAKEIPQIASTLIDLSGLPTKADLEKMVIDVNKPTVINEEIAYRNGSRYVNTLARLEAKECSAFEERCLMGPTGKRKPIELAFYKKKAFLREKLETVTFNDNTPVILVDYAKPILCYWQRTTTSCQLVAFSGRLYNRDGENKTIVGICKAQNLATSIALSRCCVSDVLSILSSQQAASLCWPMASSHYIISNILKQSASGKTISVYHHNVQIVAVFALVTMSAGAKPVCVVDSNKSASHLRMLGNYEVFTDDDVVLQQDYKNLKLDAVFVLMRPPKNVFPSLIKGLKSHGTLFVIPDDKKTYIEISDCQKDINIITRNIGDAITENSATFSALLTDCTDLLKSSGNFDNLVTLPQTATSIFNHVPWQEDRNSSSKSCSENTFNAISFIPVSIPEVAKFYRLPLDDEGLRRDCSFLVVGGIRGFGFEVAKWLVENGADVVMCTALSPPSAEKLAEVRLLEDKKGCTILLKQADVTSWKEMCDVVDELQSVAKIAGIVFSAMFLKDQMIIDADLDTCKKVVATKVLGAIVLHQLSLNMQLDFFILFSSVTGVLGNIGQLSYASANTFLDSLCRYRRYKLGLPALSVNWGPISGAGVLERFKDVATSLQTQGFNSLPYETALAFLKKFLLENPDSPQVCLSNINWPELLQKSSSKSTRFDRIRCEFPAPVLLQSRNSLENLALLPIHDRESYVEKVVRALLSPWSGTSQDEVDLRSGLYKFGMDSIGAAGMATNLYDMTGAKFKSFFFIQPKTNGLAVINDVLQQVENVKVEQLEEKDNQTEYEQRNFCLDDESKTIDKNKGDESILLSITHTSETRAEVVPLYTHNEALVKVFLVHPSRKNVFAYAGFAPSFENQTLISLYCIGCTDSVRERGDYGSVNTLADDYVKLIQEKQAKGPYYLGGYSFGGTLVYQIASTLTEKGENVSMVFMLDTSSWSALSDCDSREILLAKAEEACHETINMLVGDAMKKAACKQLGMCLKDFEVLRKEHGDDKGQLLDVLEELAENENISISLRKEILNIEHELKGALLAQSNWQPSAERYKGLLTYVRCDTNKRLRLFWDAPAQWKSLTNQMDLLHVPGDHYVNRNEVRAALCGSLLMTTAAMTYLSTVNLPDLSRLRSQVEENLVDRLKSGIAISMLIHQVVLRTVEGRLQLNSDESVLKFKCYRGKTRKLKIKLKNLHNILPALYVDEAIKKVKKCDDYDLVFCMIAKNEKLSLFKCADRDQLEHVMDCFDALFKVPLVRLNNYS